MGKHVKVLISFLGKANSGQYSGYKKTIYDFQGKSCETPFIGFALSQMLNPDVTVILGTSSSMWDVFVEFQNQGEGNEDLRLELMEAVKNKNVTDTLLDKISPLIKDSFGTAPVLKIIPSDPSKKSQVAILGIINEAVTQGVEGSIGVPVEVHIDITHGFRHLPFLAMQSGFFLEYVADRFKLKGLYYGALEMAEELLDGSKRAPIVFLEGAHEFQDWIDAIIRFDGNGDYSIFVTLLKNSNVRNTEHLEKGAYFERVLNVSGARQSLMTFLGTLDKAQPTGIASLFLPLLRERLDWVKEPSLDQQQRRLADFYLKSKDYLRAILLGYESRISQECLKNGKNPQIFKEKDNSKASLERNEEEIDFNTIKNLRNSIAHGNPSQRKDLQQILQDRDTLVKKLKDFLKGLAGG